MIQSFSIICRYEEYAVVKANRDSVFEVLEKTINEFSHWQKLHKVKTQVPSDSSHCNPIHRLELFPISLETFLKEQHNFSKTVW